MSDLDLKRILEGALFASREPMSIYQMKKLFGNQRAPTEGMLREALASLTMTIRARAIHLVEVAGGFRLISESLILISQT